MARKTDAWVAVNGNVRTPGITDLDVDNCGCYTITDGASMVMSAAQMMNGVMQMTPTAARNIQADTVANIVAAAPWIVAGNSFTFSIVNLNATNAMTVTTNTGLTLVGSMVVALSTSATFRVVYMSGGAATIYRV